MYTIIVLICTLAELSAAAYGYIFHSEIVFSSVIIYGSPIYMVIHLIGQASAFFEKSPVFIVFAFFHLVKYFSFFRSQMIEDSTPLFKIAVGLEAVYLGISAYYFL